MGHHEKLNVFIHFRGPHSCRDCMGHSGRHLSVLLELVFLLSVYWSSSSPSDSGENQEKEQKMMNRKIK